MHAASVARPAWVIAAPTASGRRLRPIEVGDDAAAVHDQHAVAHAEHLRQLAGDHQDGEALAGEPAHQGVDLGLGADVDAARRLVHDEDARLGREPLARAPPSAGCRRRAGATICSGPRARMPKRSIGVAGQPLSRCGRSTKSRGDPVETAPARRSRAMVCGADQALQAAVLRHIGDAEVARRLRAGDASPACRRAGSRRRSPA